ncbi:GGDEF domain-containing protein [Oscillochloris sp. ZM17-4]|uniref:GGDEF domain-containing protein n=1 Tax=Oscillochloris sp. ZM17-4 TaxID=2866714 RepID=UPI001C73C88F|nr:GGDEF domain-containing protein [Oscillochloris sp. ZM17-4]MBX0329851.1 GGDEF domain-containing protein [Oscillochloris sp. ZM17-4]
MSKHTWAYIWTIFLIGIICTAQAVLTGSYADIQWLTFISLTVLASLAQLYVAEAPNHVAYFATPIFVFAGLLLLEPWQFVILVVVYQTIEWAKERMNDGHRLRDWYIQPFNIATDIIAGSAARWIYAHMTMSLQPLSGLAPVLIGAVAALVFVIINHALLGYALVLARGRTLRETGMLGAENMISDMILLLQGYAIAILWELNPWLILPALSPLVLIYRALKVPILEQEAQTDEKTGLLNPRYFNRRFEEEFARAQRFRRPLGLIMADLDYLRNVNNTYGHVAGDIVIAGMGRIIGEMIRESDFAGRFGGEEFAIVLPETGPAQANVIAERIRAAVEAAQFEVSTSAKPIQVTMSLGVRCQPGESQSTTDLVEAADQAMYQAKQAGRNRVVGAPVLIDASQSVLTGS